MTKQQAIAAAQAAYRNDDGYWDRRTCRLVPSPYRDKWVVVACYGILRITLETPQEVATAAAWYANRVNPLLSA